MNVTKDSLLAAYNHLDDEGKVSIALYIDVLSVKASLQSVMEAMNAQEMKLLISLISSLSNAPSTKESMSLLRTLSKRLTKIHAHAMDDSTEGAFV